MIRLAQFQNLLFSPSSLNIPLKQADDLSWIWEAEQKPSPWTTPIQFTWHLRTQGNEGHAGQLQGNTLMLGKIEGRRRRGRQKTRWLDGITKSTNMSLSKLREMVKDRESWWAAVQGVTTSWTQLKDNSNCNRREYLEQQCVLLHEDQLGKNRSLPCGTSPHLIMNIFKVCPIENTLTR